MAKKMKRVATTIKNREDLENVMGEYAAQVLEKDRLTVQMEQEIAAVRARFEAPMAACVETGDGLFADLQAYATLHPEEFAARKSIELLHGVIGLRTSPPSVKQMNGVKAEHSLELLFAERMAWIRTKSEVDKERILADIASGNAKKEDLAKFGLRIDQPEIFYAEVRREEG